MKIQYVKKTFRSNSLYLIDMANGIIEDYAARGYELTLRQLYYQLVARDIIPNTEKSYKRLGDIIKDARDAGLIDWRSIVDRTRNRQGLSTWRSPKEIIEACAYSFRVDKWEDQGYRPFVWVEKEALAGVIQRACSDEDIQVEFISCRGYMSASTIWREAQNLRSVMYNGQIPVIIHLGDHDPSGIDMTRDNTDRIDLYAEMNQNGNGHGYIFRRIALNWDQIDQYNPPPNPAKLSDSRAGNYVAQFGYDSWELDALDPDVLVQLVQDEIRAYRDPAKWEAALEKERQQKAMLKLVAMNWDEISDSYQLSPPGKDGE